MKKLILFLLCLFSGLSYANGQISRVTFDQQDDVVLIRYYLSVPKLNNVKAYININGSARRLLSVRGDVGNVRGVGYKSISVDLEKEFGNEDVSGQISFTVKGVDTHSPFYMGLEYSYSYQAPFSFGYSFFSNWGGYFRLRFSNDTYYANKSGIYEGGTLEKKKTVYHRKSYTLGVIKKVHRHIWVYAGLGYGEYAMGENGTFISKYGSLWDDTSLWEKPKITGVELEAGLMFKIRGLFCTINYGAIPGAKIPFLSNLGIGVGYAIQLSY